MISLYNYIINLSIIIKNEYSIMMAAGEKILSRLQGSFGGAGVVS